MNGGGGLMLGDATGPEDVSAILTAHRSLGTAAILPTLISDTPEVTARIIAAVSEAARQNPGILGLHLEGPHLARAGAHDHRLHAFVGHTCEDGGAGPAACASPAA